MIDSPAEKPLVAKATAAADQQDVSTQLRPTISGTAVLCVGIAVSFFFTGGDTPSMLARQVSIIMLIAIGISVVCDMRIGLRNTVRLDVFSLLALYFLTFFEFLFPQNDFDQATYLDSTRAAINLVLIGFLGLTIGRHTMFGKKQIFADLQTLRVSPRMYIIGFFGAFFLSILYMLIAVDFSLNEWLEAIMGPRFSQPWGRSRYGSLSTLINELALLGYIVPPLAGIILAKRKLFNMPILALVVAVLLVHLFISVAGGTRNVLAVNLASLMGGYFLIQPKINWLPVTAWTLVIGLIFAFVSSHMLAFRNMGMSRYFEYGYYRSTDGSITMGQNEGFMEGKGYFVDYNLLTIAQLTEVFPEQYGHIGWNLPFVAITKPIPRAIWPSKPEDLDVGIEEALGAEGMTLAATFVGESFVAGGAIGVFLCGLILGALWSFWNRLGTLTDSVFVLLLYAMGFLVAMIAMRSIMFVTTTMLPVLALFVVGKFLLHLQRSQTNQ